MSDSINNVQCPNCRNTFDIEQTKDSGFHCPHCSADLQFESENDFFKAGVVFADYEIVRLLGIGGMGVVYLARQKSIGREVALKIMQPELLQKPTHLARFQREIHNLAQIDHPNIVKAYEAGFHEGKYFFSMSFVAGLDLKKQLEERRRVYKECEAAGIVLDIAKALGHAWDKYGLIHRDIKPSNIIVAKDGSPRIMDLGISKKVEDEEEVTMIGIMVGSPMYISPEQARGARDLDFRTDIYSLGSTFYHMLTGSPPYTGDNSMSIITKHITDPVPDPRAKLPSLSKDVARIVMRMMAKKPEARYASWDNLADELEVFITPPTPSAGLNLLPKLQSIVSVASSSVKLVVGGRRRILTLLAFLVILLSLLLGIIASSKREAVQTKAREAYEAAVAQIQSDDEMIHVEKSILLLDQTMRCGVKKYADAAKEELEKLRKRIVDVKTAKRRLEIAKELKLLRDKSSEMEGRRQFKQAVRLWEAYAAEGQYADTKEFKEESQRRKSYIDRLKSENDAGL